MVEQQHSLEPHEKVLFVRPSAVPLDVIPQDQMPDEPKNRNLVAVDDVDRPDVYHPGVVGGE